MLRKTEIRNGKLQEMQDFHDSGFDVDETEEIGRDEPCKPSKEVGLNPIMTRQTTMDLEVE